MSACAPAISFVASTSRFFTRSTKALVNWPSVPWNWFCEAPRANLAMQLRHSGTHVREHHLWTASNSFGRLRGLTRLVVPAIPRLFSQLALALPLQPCLGGERRQQSSSMDISPSRSRGTLCDIQNQDSHGIWCAHTLWANRGASRCTLAKSSTKQHETSCLFAPSAWSPSRCATRVSFRSVSFSTPAAWTSTNWRGQVLVPCHSLPIPDRGGRSTREQLSRRQQSSHLPPGGGRLRGAWVPPNLMRDARIACSVNGPPSFFFFGRGGGHSLLH